MRGSPGTKIMTVNLDSRLTNLIKITKNIQNNKPMIVALQDMPTLKQDNLIRIINANISGYSIVSKKAREGNTRVKPETAILIENGTLEEIETTEHLDQGRVSATVAIGKIKRLQEQRICIVNIYIRPRAGFQETDELFKWIQEVSRQAKIGNSQTVILGDINAEAPEWSPMKWATDENEYTRIKHNRGRQIARIIKEMKLNTLNPNPRNGGSYIGHDGHESYIDTIFGGEKILRKHTRSWLEWIGQDRGKMAEDDVKNTYRGHRVMCINLRSPYRQGDQQHKTNIRQIINYKRLNEEMFIHLQIECNQAMERARAIIERNKGSHKDQLQSVKLMNQITNTTYKHLKIIQTSVTETRRLTKNSLKLTHFNAITRKHIRKLKLLESKRNRTSNEENRVLRIRHKIVKEICTNELRTRIRASKEEPSMWQTAKLTMTYDRTINEDPLMINGRDNSVRINAEKLNEIAKEKFPLLHRETIEFMNEQEELGLVEPTKVTDKEIENSIWNARKKTYTGPEGIKFKFLMHCMPYIKPIISTICKLSFKANKVPTKCQNTLGTIIPKKTPGTFRIVHVGSPITNILEQIALHRLEYALEENKLYNDRQYGFSANRGRQDLLARIVSKVYDYQQAQEHEGQPMISIISLDIEGAFDNVNQDDIVRKLCRELWPNPIRHWLINYILNRRISIKYGQERSSNRQVCKGVPQGSPLGPILWNYVINEIDKGLNNREVEILAYADDLLIVHTGGDIQKLQLTLDTLSSRLAEIKLQVKAEKSSIMHIKTRALYQQRNYSVYINNRPIPKTSQMNILGVRINERMKLDKNNQDIQAKIIAATSKLNTLNRLNIIYQPQHWRTLIGSYLSSIVQHNNLIMVSIDKQAHEALDRTMARAIKLAFNWPPNTSNKLVRLITGTKGTKLMAYTSYMNRMHTEHHYNYSKLLEALRVNQPTGEETSNHGTHQYNIHHQRLRTHYNPDQTIETVHIDRVDEATIAWLVLERGEAATAVQVITSPMEITKRIQIKHTQYPISYFNTLTLLWHMTNDKSITDKIIVLSKQNSILMALKNEIGNHDWRTIQLRERLCRNKWTICEASQEEVYRAKQELKMLHNEQGQVSLSIIHTNEPSLIDYYQRNKGRKLVRHIERECEKTENTSITEIVCPKTKVWKDISPKWISSKTALMLSGLSSMNGRLINGKLKQPEQPDDCKVGGECRYSPHDQTASHITLHRAINCVRFASIRSHLYDILEVESGNQEPRETMKVINELMKDRRKAQEILRTLTEAAFPK